MKNEIESTLRNFYGVTECKIKAFTDDTMEVLCTSGDPEIVSIALREICKVTDDQIKVTIIDDCNFLLTIDNHQSLST